MLRRKDALTKRRWAVIALLADGYRYEEIALALGATVPIVNSDITFMCKLLGARNAPHLVAMGFRLGHLE